MVDVEEKNEGIAGVLSSFFDEGSRHFFVQKSAKFKRIGYNEANNNQAHWVLQKKTLEEEIHGHNISFRESPDHSE